MNYFVDYNFIVEITIVRSFFLNLKYNTSLKLAALQDSFPWTGLSNWNPTSVAGVMGMSALGFLHLCILAL